jgi:POT family proton-dependent oligopeptide transporter
MDTDRASGGKERTFLGHPVGLFVLFFTEMWERFCYYGMRALLVLYMIEYLKFSTEEAGATYGDYTGLVYITPLLGGFLADRYLGLRRSIMIGAALMAVGQGILTFGRVETFYLALGVLVIGNGFFKPNISTLVGQLYTPGDPRRDGAFTIFYMGINLGAFLAPVICGTVGEKIDWHLGFGLAGIGMALGLLVFILGKRALGDRGIQPARKAPAEGEKLEPMTPAEKLRIFIVAVVGIIGTTALAAHTYWGAEAPSVLSALRSMLWPLAGTVVVSLWVFLMGRTKGQERRKINAVFLIGVFVTFFWAAFEQAGSSLTLFAKRSTELEDNWITASINFILGIFGWSFDKLEASNFQSINPLFIIALAPLFSMLWTWLAARGKDPSTPVKMAIGIFLNSLGFAVMYGGALEAAGGQKVSPNWLAVAYVLQTCGELCLSPIGLSMVTRLAPARFGAMIMGVWFLANAFANKLAGVGGGLYESLPTHRLFGAIGLTLAAAGIVLILVVPFLKKLMGGVK